jgi:excisionase family DNA binding protein
VTEDSINADTLGPPRLVNADEVADRLSTSVRHIHRLVAEKRLPHVKVGHFVRFDLMDVARWVEDHKVDSVGDRSGDEHPWVKHRSDSLGHKQFVAPRTARQQAPSSQQKPVPWLSKQAG